MAAATEVWARSRDEHRSSTLEEICALAGIAYDDEHLHGYRAFWHPATLTDPDVVPLFETLRADGIKVGILSNTVWPRDWHEEIFVRDALDHLIDGAVYTSDIAWTKPAPQAFEAAMEAVGATRSGGVRLRRRPALRRHLRRAQRRHEGDPPAAQRDPDEQIGHTEGEPDAVIQRLAEIPDVIAPGAGLVDVPTVDSVGRSGT